MQTPTRPVPGNSLDPSHGASTPGRGRDAENYWTYRSGMVEIDLSECIVIRPAPSGTNVTGTDTMSVRHRWRSSPAVVRTTALGLGIIVASGVGIGGCSDSDRRISLSEFLDTQRPTPVQF